MKLCESGEALAVDMRVPVSKMVESIEAHYQASWETAQDPDGVPFPACPGGKSWDEASRKTGSGKKFYHNVIPGADFAFSREKMACARRPVTATPQRRGLARIRVPLWTASREVSRDTRTCPQSASELRCRQWRGHPCLPPLRQTSPHFKRSFPDARRVFKRR